MGSLIPNPLTKKFFSSKLKEYNPFSKTRGWMKAMLFYLYGFAIENHQLPQLQKSYSAFFYHDGQRGKLNRGAKGNF